MLWVAVQIYIWAESGKSGLKDNWATGPTSLEVQTLLAAELISIADCQAHECECTCMFIRIMSGVQFLRPGVQFLHPNIGITSAQSPGSWRPSLKLVRLGYD